GGRLVRRRVRTPAMDRLRHPAHVRSRDHRAGARSHLPGLLRHLHRPRPHARAPARAAGEAESRRRMSEAEIVAGILWLALTAYAVLAGADVGGGVWDLLANGARARDQRRAVAEATGPVWEANHGWLTFMIVGLFTGFPAAFGILSMALHLPFTIAFAGIVSRGAAFAFRAHGRDAVGRAAAWERVQPPSPAFSSPLSRPRRWPARCSGEGSRCSSSRSSTDRSPSSRSGARGRASPDSRSRCR